MKVANELLADDLFGEPTEPQPAEPETKPDADRIAGNKTALVFDIETGPVASDELEELFEFDETKTKGYELLGADFNPADVKLGNLKDKQKIKDSPSVCGGAAARRSRPSTCKAKTDSNPKPIYSLNGGIWFATPSARTAA